MRRVLFAVLPAIGALAALAFAAPAQARVSVPFGPPFTLPAGVVCPFAVDVAAVSDRESAEVTTLADGTTVTAITGKLGVSFRNDDTGNTIIQNVSGPTTTTAHPDGTGTEVARGNNYWIFGPHSQANTGEPGLVFTSGRVVLQFTGNVVTRFSLSGTQVNGCTLLAG